MKKRYYLCLSALFMAVLSLFLISSPRQVKADVEDVVVCAGGSVKASYSTTAFTSASVFSSDDNIVTAFIDDWKTQYTQTGIVYTFTVKFTGVKSGNTTIVIVDGSGAIQGTINVTVQEHSWNAGVITKVPADSEEGLKTYSCTNCGNIKFEKIASISDSDIIETIETFSSCIGKDTVESSAFSLPAGNFETISEYTLTISDKEIGTVTALQGDLDSGNLMGAHTYSYRLLFSPLKKGDTTVVVQDSSNQIVKIYNFEVTDHTVVMDEAVASTCSTPGETEGSHCSVCNTVLSGHKPLPLKDHTVVADPEIPASCIKEGLTGASHCSVCGIIISKGNVIPKTDHKWDNGTQIGSWMGDEPHKMMYKCTVCKDIKIVTLPSDPAPNKPNPDPTPNKPDPGPTPTAPKKGSTHTVSGNRYKITKSGNKNGTVELSAAAVTGTQYTVSDTIIIKGVAYKITSIGKNAFRNNKKLKSVTIGNNVTTIGANAFYGCKNLKTITVKTKKLSTVGKNAFKGIKSNAKIKVPSKKVKAYQKLLKKAGQKSTVKISK